MRRQSWVALLAALGGYAMFCFFPVVFDDAATGICVALLCLVVYAWWFMRNEVE